MALVRHAKSEPIIGPGALVKMSTLGDYASIGKDSSVLRSVIGQHCEIDDRNLIQKSTIGDMTYTGADTSILWANVGKWCNISRVVDIGGNEHNYRAASMTPTYRVNTCLAGKLSKHPDEEMITVGNDVWIGQGVAIARKPGLVIGDGAVIGSGAVVTKSVPPYAIVAGVPARVMRYRFEPEIIDMLLEARWWDWPQDVILKHWPKLSSDLDEETARELVRIARNLDTSMYTVTKLD